jgi:RNA polymerase sigma-70 factor, ECF subfamily
VANDHDQEVLVERARNSDPDAWERLYRDAYPGLLAYARRRLWGRDLADDAVSEAFARAYQRIGRFQWRDAGFNAWLYGILRNVVSEMSRRYRREYGEDHLRWVADPAVEPVEAVILDEEAAAMRAAFSRLSAEDQEVLELRVVGGLDSGEAAALLGKRPGAVRMAQSRALERLRVLMRQEVHA